MHLHSVNVNRAVEFNAANDVALPFANIALRRRSSKRTA